jgi:hypothetical protein
MKRTVMKQRTSYFVVPNIGGTSGVVLERWPARYHGWRGMVGMAVGHGIPLFIIVF